jgi:pimeloyl-ACP methyl ester carboxylesterase
MDRHVSAIETFRVSLPTGIELACRAAGSPRQPLVLFLHGFPEAAFVWDPLLLALGDQWRCVAPNLRGYAGSSAPAEVDAYRARHLVADLEALVAALGGPSGQAAAVVAHDWGGAVAWNFAALRPQRLQRLAILNSPHPALFLSALQHDPQQQAASAYMNFLCRPDAAALLAADDFRRLWRFFEGMGARDSARLGGGWLSDGLKDRYREAWSAGLEGPLNYYRASPLRPPTADQQHVMSVSLPDDLVTVKRPTLVIWGLDDTALPPSLLDGLERFVPDLTVQRWPGATHWLVHEQPRRLAQVLREFLQRPVQSTT